MDLPSYIKRISASSNELCKYHSSQIIYIYSLNKIKFLKFRVFHILQKFANEFVII